MPEPVAVPSGAHPAPERAVSEPGFIWRSQVYFDDLDAMGFLHNSRFLVLAERANSAFFEANGWRWEADARLNPDQFYVVREQWVRYLEPIHGPGPVTVEMWVARLGRSTATFAFRVRSGDGAHVHADVHRVQVKLDPATLRPTAWTPALRGQLERLLRMDAA